MTKEFEILPTPVKGQSDWRDFRALRLANGVTVMLVHDPYSRTFGAAARVAAGAAADPRDCPGLAHFCEHMVFLGSKDFPSENAYKAYLAQHGGRSNASTSLYATTFYFEVVGDKAAEGALDRFVSFFVSPLFTQSGTGREVQAVDSENSKNLVNDGRRRLQILKEICDQAHYVSKFTTGNNTTLLTTSEKELHDLREMLLAFHAYHYRPEHLTVTLAGPQELDTLQEWAVSRWSAMATSSFDKFRPEIQQSIVKAAREAPRMVTGQGIEEPDFHPPLLSAPDLLPTGAHGPLLITTKPLRPLRQLIMFWTLPSAQHIPDSSPLSLLGHLLGHEGPSSIFAHLQNEGLLTTLSAGPRMSAPDFSIFQVSINLSPTGEERWTYVVRTVLDYLQLLVHSLDAAKDGSKSALQDWQRIWSEKVQLANLHFDYQTSPGSVYDYPSSLTHSIFQHGTRDCLKAGYMLDHKEDTSDGGLPLGTGLPLERMHDSVHRLLRPENLVIERCSLSAWEEMEQREATCQEDSPQSTSSLFIERRKERWYGVEFFLSTLDPSDKHLADLLTTKELQGVGTTAPPLDLPRPNSYIPRTFELCPDLPEHIRREAKPRIDEEMAPPDLVVDDPKRGRLWHRLDDRYALPKAYVTINIANAAVQNVQSNDGTWEYSQEASIRSSILSNMFSQAQAQETYDADLAGLYWNVNLISGGIRFGFSGYHDRLPDLTMDILKAFARRSTDSWVREERFFRSAKDKLLRNLRTFFSSRRADSHANYYRDLLLEDQQGSIEESIHVAESVTLDDVLKHHGVLLQNECVFLDCLCLGNLSKDQSIDLFLQATDLLTLIHAGQKLAADELWRPGRSEARLTPGEDFELHFASENLEEENGAVLVTFQSPVPGYVGPAISTPESLQNTASLRLLSQILREPIFNELRTKQTLGYIVSSYFESGSSMRPACQAELGPMNVSVDAFSIVVLSRKVSPPEVAERIDAFLDEFRTTLSNLPESEIKSHAESLSTKLLKPIQKLSTEANTQFSKILRYAPQILDEKSAEEIPWNPVVARELASKLQSLDRSHLLETWDSMFVRQKRARIISCVYGSTFPFEKHFKARSSRRLVLTKVSDIVEIRKRLPAYDNNPTQIHRWWIPARMTPESTIAVAALVGVGALGWTIWTRTKKSSK